jgi:probable HAF family extracellular repeat protein
MTDLGTLGGTYSKAYAINASAKIVGQAYLAGNTQAHAFLFENGTMTDLDTLGNAHSEALAINSTGVIVGDFDSNQGDVVAPRAFIVVDGKMQDLNELIAPDSGWVLAIASGINDAGQIAGWGTLNGSQHAFYLR